MTREDKDLVDLIAADGHDVSIMSVSACSVFHIYYNVAILSTVSAMITTTLSR